MALVANASPFWGGHGVQCVEKAEEYIRVARVRLPPDLREEIF